ncbi:MAG: hypothetical protein JWP64_1643 [Pseudonocardia sp.]|uniref:DUF3043 domain-containing protein n=1 Tax=Pseudonocardia sp. TaxID=60912 RepID=UPI00261D0507|nr:DUF3043 domain-containing protein [Pseudonocardia sp.]MCU1626694.1 hypothetical protein [Pseudonocardia sp.]
MSGRRRTSRARKPVRTARPVPPERPRPPRPAATATAGGPVDADLQPRDRGPVRALVRDLVDARRRLVGLFAPVFGLFLITTFGPASDLQHQLWLGSLAALAVVAVDALLLGRATTAAARAAFPDAQVSAPATTWYAFMRAHRPRNTRRPGPRVRPGS